MSSENLPDYYEILGVDKTATQDEIKSAYRRSAKKYHPDNNDVPNAAYFFKLINDANETLCDSAKRKKYDEELAAPRRRSNDDLERQQQEEVYPGGDAVWDLDGETVFQRSTTFKCKSSREKSLPVKILLFLPMLLVKMMALIIGGILFVIGAILQVLSTLASLVVGFFLLLFGFGLIYYIIEYFRRGYDDLFNIIATAVILGIIIIVGMLVLVLPAGVMELGKYIAAFAVSKSNNKRPIQDRVFSVSTNSGKKKYKHFSTFGVSGIQYIALTPKTRREEILVEDIIIFRFSIDADAKISLSNIESREEFSKAYRKFWIKAGAASPAQA